MPDPTPLRESLIALLDIFWRRWPAILLPVVVTVVSLVALMQYLPTRYEATSLLLIRAANQTSGTVPAARVDAYEQMQALTGWLKSDAILTGLLPVLMPGAALATPAELSAAIADARDSLTVQLVGNSILEIRLEGASPRGLGRKLEAVVARLVSGLTGPEKDVFNAAQYLQFQRRSAVRESEAALYRAIAAHRLGPPGDVIARLTQLDDLGLKIEEERDNRIPGQDTASDEQRRLEAAAQDLRESISRNDFVFEELVPLHRAHRNAVQDDVAAGSFQSTDNYVGIFSSPENLLVVGRPRDPVKGSSVVLKPGIVALALSGLFGIALAGLLELKQDRLRTRHQFEMVSGLPVVGRVGSLPGRKENIDKR